MKADHLDFLVGAVFGALVVMNLYYFEVDKINMMFAGLSLALVTILYYVGYLVYLMRVLGREAREHVQFSKFLSDSFALGHAYIEEDTSELPRGMKHRIRVGAWKDGSEADQLMTLARQMVRAGNSKHLYQRTPPNVDELLKRDGDAGSKDGQGEDGMKL